MTSLGAFLAGLLLAQPTPRAGSAPPVAPGAAGAAGAARGPNARVVSGPSRLTRGASLPLGRAQRTGPREHLVLLTTGGCLIRMAPSSLFRLAPPAVGARCPSLYLHRGAANVLAERRAGGADLAMTLFFSTGSIALAHGVGTWRVGPKAKGLCLAHGKARAPSLPPGPHRDPTPGVAQGGAPAVSALPTGTGEIQAGQCLWLIPGGHTVAPYAEGAQDEDRALFLAGQGLARPSAVPLPDLSKELARVKAAGPGGERGGTEVEGGGQSMCLETGAEGGVGDVGTSGSVEIVKPPPPTRLHLRVVIGR